MPGEQAVACAAEHIAGGIVGLVGIVGNVGAAELERALFRDGRGRIRLLIPVDEGQLHVFVAERSAVLCVAPVVLGALHELALGIRLKVEQDLRHSADLHMDAVGQLCAVVLRVADGNVSLQRLTGLDGRERIAGERADVGGLLTGIGRRDGPVEHIAANIHQARAALGRQAEVGRLLEGEVQRFGGKEELLRLLYLHASRAEHGLALQKLGRHSAALAVRAEQAVCVDGAEAAVLQPPAHVGRQVGGIAVGVDARGSELHGSARKEEVVLRRERGVVKAAGRLRRRDDHQRRGDNALGAVGRVVLDGELIAALVAGGVGRGAAAVEVDGFDAALRLQNLGHFIDGHAVGQALTAVSHEDDERAIRLQTDGVAGSLIACVQAALDLSVLQQPERAGDGFRDVIRGGSVVADVIAAVLQNGKIRLEPVVVLVCLDEVAFHDKIAAALCRLHIIVVGVHSRNDGLARCGLIGGGLGRGRLQIPAEVLRGLRAALGRAARRVVVGIGCLELHGSTGGDGGHIAEHLCAAAGIVQNDLRFRQAVHDRIVCLRDQDLIGRGAEVRVGARRKCGRKQAGEQRADKQGTQDPPDDRHSSADHDVLSS